MTQTPEFTVPDFSTIDLGAATPQTAAVSAREAAADREPWLTPEQIERHLAEFEPPTAEEGPLRVVRVDPLA